MTHFINFEGYKVKIEHLVLQKNKQTTIFQAKSISERNFTKSGRRSVVDNFLWK